MQLISLNPITQGQHGQYNAVDIGPSPDPYYYAPEDGTITSFGDGGTCGLRLVLEGATGRHGFCHNELSLVKVGATVKRGQRLAKMGYTGYTQPDNVPAGTHVHWVIYRNGLYVYPPSLVNQPFIKLTDTPGVSMPTKEDVIQLTVKWLGRNPSDGEIDKFTKSGWRIFTAWLLENQQTGDGTILTPGNYIVK